MSLNVSAIFPVQARPGAREAHGEIAVAHGLQGAENHAEIGGNVSAIGGRVSVAGFHGGRGAGPGACGFHVTNGFFHCDLLARRQMRKFGRRKIYLLNGLEGALMRKMLLTINLYQPVTHGWGACPVRSSADSGLDEPERHTARQQTTLLITFRVL